MNQIEYSDLLYPSSYTRRLEAQVHTPATGYIFSGPRGVGKGLLANRFVKSLLCVDQTSANPCNKCSSCNITNVVMHGDYFEISRMEGKITIGIEQIQVLIKSLQTKATISLYSVVLINESDLLSKSAANALLKILEEPQGRTVFILLDNRQFRILPTILSRCQQMYFKPISQIKLVAWLQKNVANKNFAGEVAFFSKGRPLVAHTLLNDTKLFEEQKKRTGSLIEAIIVKNVEAKQFFLSSDTNWSTKQNDAREALEDCKYIWHNILLYALGLDTYLKSYHNQTALKRFIEENSLEDIQNKFTNIENAAFALTNSVPGEILLDSII